MGKRDKKKISFTKIKDIKRIYSLKTKRPHPNTFKIKFELNINLK